MIGRSRTTLDKEAVRASFSRAAAEYDRWAEAQRQIAQRLAQLCPAPDGIHTVLELGCGTGILTAHLRRLYPRADLVAVDLAPGMIDHCRRKWADDPRATFVEADAETYSPAQKMDLICSSCTLQWFVDPLAATEQMAAGLRPGGRLALAVPVVGTAGELAESYRRALGHPMPGLEFASGDDLLDRLRLLGLRLAHRSLETLRLECGDPWEVLRSFKGLGATFAGQGWARPLTAGQLRRVMAEYRRHFSTDLAGVSLTYRVLYVVSQAAQ